MNLSGDLAIFLRNWLELFTCAATPFLRRGIPCLRKSTNLILQSSLDWGRDTRSMLNLLDLVNFSASLNSNRALVNASCLYLTLPLVFPPESGGLLESQSSPGKVRHSGCSPGGILWDYCVPTLVRSFPLDSRWNPVGIQCSNSL
jgi:hypothetical protein